MGRMGGVRQTPACSHTPLHCSEVWSPFLPGPNSALWETLEWREKHRLILARLELEAESLHQVSSVWQESKDLSLPGVTMAGLRTQPGLELRTSDQETQGLKHKLKGPYPEHLPP